MHLRIAPARCNAARWTGKCIWEDWSTWRMLPLPVSIAAWVALFNVLSFTPRCFCLSSWCCCRRGNYTGSKNNDIRTWRQVNIWSSVSKQQQLAGPDLKQSPRTAPVQPSSCPSLIAGLHLSLHERIRWCPYGLVAISPVQFQSIRPIASPACASHATLASHRCNPVNRLLISLTRKQKDR